MDNHDWQSDLKQTLADMKRHLPPGDGARPVSLILIEQGSIDDFGELAALALNLPHHQNQQLRLEWATMTATVCADRVSCDGRSRSHHVLSPALLPESGLRWRDDAERNQRNALAGWIEKTFASLGSVLQRLPGPLRRRFSERTLNSGTPAGIWAMALFEECRGRHNPPELIAEVHHPLLSPQLVWLVSQNKAASIRGCYTVLADCHAASLTLAHRILKAAERMASREPVKSQTVEKAQTPLSSDNLVLPHPLGKHSADFSTVTWGREVFIFTEPQSKVVGFLWREWEKGTPYVSNKTLCDLCDSEGERLRDVFRSNSIAHPAWQKFIVSVGRGKYKLEVPPTDPQ